MALIKIQPLFVLEEHKADSQAAPLPLPPHFWIHLTAPGNNEQSSSLIPATGFVPEVSGKPRHVLGGERKTTWRFLHRFKDSSNVLSLDQKQPSKIGILFLKGN